MSTVTLQNAMEALESLNNTTQTMSDTLNEPGHSDGLYIMINKMISDLAAIKIAIKGEERKIQKAVNDTIKSAAFNAITTNPDTYDIPNTIYPDSSRATLRLATGLGGTDGGNRHVSTGNANTFPGVYSSNSKIYSECAVFGILAQAAGIIRTLKNGDITDAENGTDYSVE